MTLALETGGSPMAYRELPLSELEQLIKAYNTVVERKAKAMKAAAKQ